MNDAVQLSGEFRQAKNPARGGGITLSKGDKITSSQIKKLRDELKKTQLFWHKEKIINGVLVGAYYDCVVPKSKRILKLFSMTSQETANKYVVGAKFYGEEDDKKHVITYFLSNEQVKKALDRMGNAVTVLNNIYGGEITDENYKLINKKGTGLEHFATTTFLQTIADLRSVARFDLVDNTDEAAGENIVTFYNVTNDIIGLLNNLGLGVSESSRLSKNTLALSRDDIGKIRQKVPYLIAMSVSDISEYALESESNHHQDDSQPLIPHPTNEPVVGVIDTLFDEGVYFREWVEYEEYVSPQMIDGDKKSYEHGTAVTSIIVDGARGNPRLDDECGRFRVKHFGVAVYGANSSATIIRNIRTIVEENPEIKVWNLSLGASREINSNFISPEAAILDELQYKNDIIFIVAGTNLPDGAEKGMKVGAPADSLNSIVVNSVNIRGDVAPYARCGRVLSFFNKPDVSCFGGVKHDRIICCTDSLGGMRLYGTSFAAPWITRKMAFLIYKMGLSREIAKALIIDSAVKWKLPDEEEMRFKGYGIVPTSINDIIKTSQDEIRFCIEGQTTAYEMFSYNLPVPKDKGKYAYIARATLCYFPECTREQGVDYTNTELEMAFGRLDDDNKIRRLRSKRQAERGQYVYEKDAREIYRKWDNVKHIQDESGKGGTLKPVQAFKGKNWGISVKSMARLTTERDNIRFGIVVTLKNLHKKNHYDEFVKSCIANGWHVSSVAVDNRLKLYNEASEELQLE